MTPQALTYPGAAAEPVLLYDRVGVLQDGWNYDGEVVAIHPEAGTASVAWLDWEDPDSAGMPKRHERELSPASFHLLERDEDLS